LKVEIMIYLLDATMTWKVCHLHCICTDFCNPIHKH